jgi:thiol-disulfide isomerase/thioredoxin
MRRLSATLLAGALFWMVPQAQAGPPGLGSPAPVVDLGEWIQGPPVDLAARKGKAVTVLEFWASWCAPCIDAIPHMTELQHKYADKGVRVVGVTTKDPGNTKKMVKRLVKKMSAKLDYAIVFDESGKAYDAFMTASRQESIPTAFVIDKTGDIAWIGHPDAGLDDALAQIVAGTYDVQKAKKLFDIDMRIEAAAQRGAWQVLLDEMDKAIRVDPKDPRRWMTKFLVYAYQLDDHVKAKDAAKRALAIAVDDPDMIAELATQLVTEDNEHGYSDMAVGALAMARKAHPSNTSVGIANFLVLAATGDTTKAKLAARDVITTAEGDAPLLNHLAQILSSPEHVGYGGDMALLAATMAIQAEPDEPAYSLTLFRVQNDYKKDWDAAMRTATELVRKSRSDPNFLNGFAWMLLTDEGLAGKYNAVALRAAEAMSLAPGGDTWSHLETLALAKFEAGKVDEAIAAQKLAIKRCTQEFARAGLEAGLARYEKGKK